MYLYAWTRLSWKQRRLPLFFVAKPVPARHFKFCSSRFPVFWMIMVVLCIGANLLQTFRLLFTGPQVCIICTRVASNLGQDSITHCHLYNTVCMHHYVSIVSYHLPQYPPLEHKTACSVSKTLNSFCCHDARPGKLSNATTNRALSGAKLPPWCV